MKTIKTNAIITVKLLSLLFIFLFSFGSQRAAAQLFYASNEGSQVKISNSKNNALSAPSTNYFTCEGKFSNSVNGLEQLQSLKFSLPLSLKHKEQLLVNLQSLNAEEAKNDVNFELTHSMVLGELNVIHAIGFLDIQGARMRVDFQFHFIENNSETITLSGTKAIRLSDFKKEDISIFAGEKEQDFINFDLKLVVKNHNQYLASVK